jgi:hypothetical protein
MSSKKGWTKWSTTDLEANRENSEAVAVHNEALNEEAEEDTVKALEDRHGAERRRSQSDDVSRQTSAASRRRLTRSASPGSSIRTKLKTAATVASRKQDGYKRTVRQPLAPEV